MNGIGYGLRYARTDIRIYLLTWRGQTQRRPCRRRTWPPVKSWIQMVPVAIWGLATSRLHLVVMLAMMLAVMMLLRTAVIGARIVMGMRRFGNRCRGHAVVAGIRMVGRGVRLGQSARCENSEHCDEFFHVESLVETMTAWKDGVRVPDGVTRCSVERNTDLQNIYDAPLRMCDVQ
jgi:hypothetical protein